MHFNCKKIIDTAPWAAGLTAVTEAAFSAIIGMLFVYSPLCALAFYSATASEGGRGADRPNRRECVSPVGARARHFETIFFIRATRAQQRRSRSDSNRHADTYCCAAVTYDPPLPAARLLMGQLLLSLCFDSYALVGSLALVCCAGERTKPPASTSA